MKAAVLFETNKPLEIQELSLPELKPGQVLVKILCTGICRAQLNEMKAHKGPDKYLPHTLGHEASGVVEKVGDDVGKVSEGDYVVLTWIKGDGADIPNCEYTRNSDGAKVNSGAITTFNEYSVVSENRIVKIPVEVPPSVAALLGCAIPTGVGIVRHELNVEKNNSIAIFGVGGIGSSVLLGAEMVGASPIIAVDINDDKLKFAKESGATHIINSSKENVISRINEIVEGGVDYSVDCVGVPMVSEAAFESINYSGTAIIAGNAAMGEKISIPPFDLIRGKKIIGTWGGATNPDVDIPFYAQQYLDGKLNVDSLISETYSLININKAFKDLREGKVIRALVDINEINS